MVPREDIGLETAVGAPEVAMRVFLVVICISGMMIYDNALMAIHY